MDKIIEKELSYELVGIFFEIQGELGRFCRERQYADVLEKKLIKRKIKYQREVSVEIGDRKSNFIDFIVENKIFIDLKAKPFIKKDDYYQMKRYLEITGFELGLIVNFRDEYLKPRRVLNKKSMTNSDASIYKAFGYVDSDKKFVASARSKGQVMLLTVLILGSTVLSASTIAGYLMTLKIRASSDITNSAKAIFAADAGIEWELYKQFKNPDYPRLLLSNNADFVSSNDGQNIKSIGQAGNSSRAFEIQFYEATSTLP